MDRLNIAHGSDSVLAIRTRYTPMDTAVPTTITNTPTPSMASPTPSIKL